MAPLIWANVSRDELVKLYQDEGWTTQQLGQHFGVSGETIRVHLAQLGVQRRRGKPWASKEARAQLSCEQLRKLYVVDRLSMAAIAQKLGVGETTVWGRLRGCGIESRDLSSSRIQYPRSDFGGDLVEKAYLVGFRQGDLWVARTHDGPFSASISVACVSSRQEQIDLFQELFSRYGHVAVTRAKNGKYIQYDLQCCLNLTFEFLIPKQDRLPEWVEEQEQLFAAYVAGYVDAEGSFQLCRDGTSRFTLGSYDVNLLKQIQQRLATRDAIACPPPRLSAPAGRIMAQGYRSRKDFWTLSVGRKQSLHRLCRLLEPYLKHRKRRSDMLRLYENINRRGVTVSE
jgi:hypothetical protein